MCVRALRRTGSKLVEIAPIIGAIDHLEAYICLFAPLFGEK